jgi:CheY-like chemotaxis protein
MKRILVVNDSQELLELYRTLLTEEGYEVIVYSSAIEDLREIEQVKPDLILLDIMLGNREVSGWQMLEKLKLFPATASIPVILCTAALDRIRQQQGYLTSHGVLVILKPFNLDDLLACIEKALHL